MTTSSLFVLTLFLCVTSSVSEANNCKCGCECGPIVELVEGCCDKPKPTDTNIDVCPVDQTVEPGLPDECPLGVERERCAMETCDVPCALHPCAKCFVYDCGGCHPVHFLMGKRVLCEKPQCPYIMESVALIDLSLANIPDLNRELFVGGMLRSLSAFALDHVVGYKYSTFLFVTEASSLHSISDPTLSYSVVEITYQLLFNMNIGVEIPTVSALKALDAAIEEFETHGRDFVEWRVILLIQNAPSVDPAALLEKIRDTEDRGYQVVVVGSGAFAMTELPAIAMLEGVQTIAVVDEESLLNIGPNLAAKLCA